MQEELSARGIHSIVTLSPRELEVLEHAALGETNQEIANDLSVSIHVVKFHLASTYRKLGVANRTEAVVALLREGQASFELQEG